MLIIINLSDLKIKKTQTTNPKELGQDHLPKNSQFTYLTTLQKRVKLFPNINPEGWFNSFIFSILRWLIQICSVSIWLTYVDRYEWKQSKVSSEMRHHKTIVCGGRRSQESVCCFFSSFCYSKRSYSVLCPAQHPIPIPLFQRKFCFPQLKDNYS